MKFEIDEGIVKRGGGDGEPLEPKEVGYLARLVTNLRMELEVALKRDGRVHGLLEAAQIMRESAQKDKVARFFYGRGGVAQRKINCGILLKVAEIVEGYAGALANPEAALAAIREEGALARASEGGAKG